MSVTFIRVGFISSHFWGIYIQGEVSLLGFSPEMGRTLFVTRCSVSAKVNVVLFTLPLFLCTLASSHRGLGYSAGEGGMGRLLRHPFYKTKFFYQRNK